MSPYEVMLGWMSLFIRRYHWTPDELLSSPLALVLDLYVLECKLEDTPQVTPIDEIGIF